MNLASILPAPKQTHFQPDNYIPRSIPSAGNTSSPSPSTSSSSNRRPIPKYGKRKGWIPRVLEDFGDGGAYPELHVAQYPLDMGKKDNMSVVQKSIPVTLDSSGRIKYESIIDPHGSKQIMARHEDLSAKRFDDDELRRPDPEEEAEIIENTKKALEKSSRW